jgi:hypothetical protein
MHKRITALTIFLLISAAFVVARYSVSAQGQDSGYVRSQFLGTWKLVSTEERLKDVPSAHTKMLGRTVWVI